MNKSVAIIIPVYNEEKRIGTTLNALIDFANQCGFQFKLYIINDGSTDNTIEAIQSLTPKFNFEFELINNQTNRGKGYVIRQAMTTISGFDFYYLADADLSAQWQTLSDFIGIAEANNFDCVVASRALPESNVTTSAHKKLLGNLANAPIRLALGLHVYDTQCGYKLFSAKCQPAFSLQKLERWGFDFEVLYIIKQMGLSIKEIGIQWQNKEGSKVTAVDYLRTFRDLWDVFSRKEEIKQAINKN